MSDPRRPGPISIERCVAAWQRIKHALQAEGDELVDDEQVLVAMLDADPNILGPDDLLRRFIAAIAFAESRAAEAEAFAKGMKARSERYETRAAVMRFELLEVMQALERKSFSGSPFGTVSVKAGQSSTVVLDEEKIPDEYFDTKRTLSRSRLRADLKQGVVIDGAVLSNPMPALSITYAKAAREPEPVEVED